MRPAVACLVLMMAAACGGGEQNPDRISSGATIEIIEPAANAVVEGDSVDVRIGLEGGRIVDEVSRNLTPDEGHLHLSVDGNIVTQTFGLTQKLEAPDPGKHLLQAEFVAKDHGPFAPRVIASVPIEVR